MDRRRASSTPIATRGSASLAPSIRTVRWSLFMRDATHVPLRMRLSVVVTGTDGNMWVKRWTGVVWEGWFNCGKPASGVSTSSTPAAANISQMGGVLTFVRDVNNKMFFSSDCN